MAVPDFQSWLLPLLKRLADGEVHRMADLYEQLAGDLDLSDADKQERLPSGSQQTYMNRIAWARTYLKKAELLVSPGRSLVQITPAGRDVLGQGLSKLMVADLKRLSPEFLRFHAPRQDASIGVPIEPPRDSWRPQLLRDWSHEQDEEVFP